MGVNAIKQIERRQHAEHAAGHEQRVAAPLYAAAQRDQRSGLRQRAARHHQRNGLGRRQHVQQDRSRDGRKCKPHQA
jgi:hypothetical protein